jgi:Methyltransferase FkbM domain
VSTDRGFARVRWDRSIDVAVATLDDLIAAHGEPAFCKIDVEGFEVDVLAGLTRPVRALSFEYLPPAHDAALAALDLVARLGAAGSNAAGSNAAGSNAAGSNAAGSNAAGSNAAGSNAVGSGAAGGYRYNYAPVETMRFASEEWLDMAGLVRLLDRFRPLGRSGDVYARLT